MSKIEWTNETWNPVTGCNKVSQGCKNCYAEIMHRRLRGMFPNKYRTPFLDGASIHQDELDRPFNWGKPRMVFVNSMSDLFHDDVPFDFIDSVYDVMDACRIHTFQILTKRAERMVEYYRWKENGNGFKFDKWPLSNVWIGISCEDQATADQRIPQLLQIPAAVRFLSCEPLLETLYLDKPLEIFLKQSIDFDPELSKRMFEGKVRINELLHWVICGGESGHKARPMHPDWVRSLRDQCAAANVPFFFKQWGEWLPLGQHDKDGNRIGAFIIKKYPVYTATDVNGVNRHTGKLQQLTPACYSSMNIGKSKSGNFLDGKQHLEFPKSLTPHTNA